MNRLTHWAFVLALLLPHAHATAAEGEAAVWEALRSGDHVIALLRHAVAPGTGDPPDFTIGDCATQRNLSDEGRAQAQRIDRTDLVRMGCDEGVDVVDGLFPVDG